MANTLKINIICVGKVKEDFYRKAIAEFQKRLKAYVDLSIIEVADSPAPEKLSESERLSILKEEGERILQRLPKGKTYALAIKGRTYSSEGFANQIEETALSGESTINFIIGGSLGLSDEVYAACNERLSFSTMTFPHQLMRLILIEQIYRALRILHNHPYHK